MRSKHAVAIVAVCVLTACGGGAARRVSATGPSSKTSTRPAPVVKGAPRVLLQVGTSYQTGSLVQFCSGGSCRDSDLKAPPAIAGSDPALFIVDQRPRAARVRLFAGPSTLIDERQLHPGTTMLYAPDVRPGTYLMRLEGSWKGRTGVWLFRIKVLKASR